MHDRSTASLMANAAFSRKLNDGVKLDEDEDVDDGPKRTMTHEV